MIIDGVMGRLTSIVFTVDSYWWASLFLCVRRVTDFALGTRDE